MRPVFRHLAIAYRTTYMWFTIMVAIGLIALAVLLPLFHWHPTESIWQSVGTQAPRWYLFVMGIMFGSVNLPVGIANGVTRKVYYKGALVFAAASSVLFGLLMTIGFGVERLVYQHQGILGDYPIATWGDAVKFAIGSVLSSLAFTLAGWTIGLAFYRYQVWVGLLIVPLVVVPIVGGELISHSGLGKYQIPLAVVAIAVTALCGHLVSRDVPLRAKKA